MQVHIEPLGFKGLMSMFVLHNAFYKPFKGRRGEERRGEEKRREEKRRGEERRGEERRGEKVAGCNERHYV
jgi:hypothetical protein